MSVTDKDLNDSLDRLAKTALALKASHNELLAVANAALEALDDVYDVDQPHGESAKEYPFRGAGELMTRLSRAIKKGESL